AAFVERVRSVRLKDPQIPYLSNVTGEWVTAREATDPDYWGRQLRHTVRFADGLGHLLRTQDGILLEVGPGQTLSNMARQQLASRAKQVVIPTLPPLRDQEACVSAHLDALARLWLNGVEPSWDK